MTRSLRTLISLVAGLTAFALAARRVRPIDQHAYAALKPQASSPAARSRSLGREAKNPEQIPALGWWEILKRTATKFSDNDLMGEAAAVTFFALLSVFPAITAIVSIYGLFADPSTIQGHLDMAGGIVPSGGMDIVREQIKHLTQSPASGLSAGAVIGVVAALWSANQGTKAMFNALNDVYGEHESRSFVRKTATSLAFTMGGIALLLLMLGAIVLLPLIFNAIGLSSTFDLAAKILRWPFIFAALIFGLALLFRFGPSRNAEKWRWVTWGATIAALMWIALSLGFSWYVEQFGNYNKTYGSLGAIIGFMTWIWLSSTALLLGAQVNAEMETQTMRDTTTGAPKPIGLRGAAAANRVS